MKLSRPHCLLASAISLAALAAAPAAARAQAILPGEILVNEFGSGSVQRYSAAGTLTQTYATGASVAEGASLTPDGNVVTDAFGNNVAVTTFTPAGTKTSFSASPNTFAGDVSAFADGTLAVSDQSDDTIQLFSPAGTLLHTVALSGDHPFGNTVGADGNLYVADLNNNNLDVINENGTLATRIHLSFQPSDVSMSAIDGTFWVSGRSNGLVEHINASGTVLGSFSAGFNGGTGSGISLSADGLSVYVDSETGTTIRHYDLNGNLLNTISLVSPSTPLFFTVVPNALPAMPLPEPGTWATLLGGLGVLGAVRYFRARRA